MKLGPYDLNTIVTGDARELALAIPDESVDLIFTDPIYNQINDYRWLAETAARVLKQDRACLVWTATPLLSKVIKAMEPPLDYAWALIMKHYGNPYPGKTGICVYSFCVWFEKGASTTYRKIADHSDGLIYGRVELPIAKNNHIWGKSPNVTAKWCSAFTKENWVVVDFFTGGGTVAAVCKMLGRQYLAFEICPETAEKARERVRMTQPPLFTLQPQQLELMAQ